MADKQARKGISKPTIEGGAKLPTELRTSEEILAMTQDLNRTLKELTKTLKIIEKHEFLELHKSKWKIIVYNVFLGILFAVGTVTGLLLLSWFSYFFFKDSVILKDVIDNQLKLRQFNLEEMRDKISKDVKKDILNESKTVTPKSATGKTVTP